MPASQPNIVLIMTDQQRFDTIDAWGHDHMITPNMDRLAREGVSFRHAYCPGATCVASRAALFTGMYPHTTGVYTFQPWAEHRNWVQDLADAGYWCVNMGKMHFTPRDVPGGFHERVIVENPTNKNLANGGSDDDWGRYLSIHGIDRPNDRNQTDPDWLAKHQGVPWHHDERFHSDVFIGDSAVTWIENHRGSRPFFLQVGFAGPHEPWDPLPRHLAMYSDVEVPPAVSRQGELDDKPPQHVAHLDMHATTDHESQIGLRGATGDDIARMRRHYYANITTVDEKVGEVIDALGSRGYLDDSLVIFCSDHGELLGDHGLAYKWLMYDPITHVPLIMWRPGDDGPSRDVTDLVSLVDLGPTVLEAAGVQVPSYMEGRSLRAYLDGESIAPREFVFCEDNYQIMMRNTEHKLVYYIGQELGELYDLSDDPGELWNRWAHDDYATVKNDMLLRLLGWMATSNYYNAGYKQTRSRQTPMRWSNNPYLHGREGRPQPRQAPCL